MKNIKSIAKNFNSQTLKSDDHHELQNKVNPIVKSLVDQVFIQLSIIFPAWKYAWQGKTEEETASIINSAKKEWTKAFYENDINSAELIKCGLIKARATDTDFLPSCGKFISWCSPSAEDLGYPCEQLALKKCITYRNNKKMGLRTYSSHFIIELTSRVDWWVMNSVSNQQQQKKAETHFKTIYLDFISNYQEPLESDCERLEASEVVKDRMSPEQLEDGRKRGLNVLSDIKHKLKCTKFCK